MLLNDLKNNETIKLKASSGTEYGAYINRLFTKDLVIYPNEVRKITIRFKKPLSSNKTSKEIEILNVIKDYEDYIKNTAEYTDTINITLKVEG